MDETCPPPSPSEMQGKLAEVYTYGNDVRRVHKPENGADSSEMVKRTCMMSVPADSAHQGRVWNAARVEEMSLKNQRVKIPAALELYKTLRACWVSRCRTE